MRSITIGLPIWTASPSQLAEELRRFLEQARVTMDAQGLSTRTIRFALPPVPPEFAQPGAIASTLAAVQQLASDLGVRWYCLPVNLIDGANHKALLDELLNLLVKNQRLFVNLMVADETRISPRGARAAAEFILGLSRRSHNGFDGFRVGISCACNPNTPFFPFSRHQGERPKFTIALETTAEALRALRALPRRSPIGVQQGALKASLLERILRADRFGRDLESATGLDYGGLDASYAPFPDGESSVGSLVECFGVSPVGTNGTLFVTSVLTDTLRAALRESNARCAGFNGVMYSVLEDPKLASSNNLASLSMEKLLLFSSLCGCGIDMVPIPATTYVEEVAAIVLDVAALAVRLAKPLGVRLVAIPNKQINEVVNFNLDFLCDGRVMNPGISDSVLCQNDNALWQYLNQPGGSRSDNG